MTIDKLDPKGLEPCPFEDGTCDKDALIIQKHNDPGGRPGVYRGWVSCQDCGAHGPEAYADMECIDASAAYNWNRRASTAGVPGETPRVTDIETAARALLADWDDRMNGEREELKTERSTGHEYWSPRASLISSPSIAALRAALEASLSSQHGETPRVTEELVEALRDLIDHVESITCTHESTHRGGFLWTICDDCGRKWADDQGGFKAHEDAPSLVRARAALSASLSSPPVSQQAEAVAVGWKLVPVEPTAAMISAYCEAQNNLGIGAFANARLIWPTMLASSPAPDAVEPAIKALEWQAGSRLGSHTAHGLGILYVIDTDHECAVLAKWEGSSVVKSAHGSVDAAKAFAQTSEEARIRSSLVPTSPVSAPGVVEQEPTITIDGQTYRKFIRPDDEDIEDDGTPRCISCGQIDEEPWHDDSLCPYFPSPAVVEGK